MAAHEVDVAFLHSFNVMDYSLLIGIHNMDDTESGNEANLWRGATHAAGSRDIYFIGLIDFLIFYGAKKQSEHLLRVSQGHGEDTSCVSPYDYAVRQVAFLRKSVFTYEEADEAAGTQGRLMVTIVSGHNLVNADGPLGTSDPYATVMLGLNKRRTPTIEKNLNPTWDCTLCVPVNFEHADSEVMIEVWDDDSGCKTVQGGDDFLGRLRIPLEEIIQKGKVEIDKAKLQDIKQGDITVTFEFVKAS